MPVVHEDEQRAVAAHLALANVDNPVNVHETRIIAGSGETRWNSWTQRALFDQQGRAVEFQGVGRDITDRKEAEELLVAQLNLGIELSATLTLNDALDRCLETAIRVSQMDNGGIYLVDNETGEIRLAYCQGLPLEFARSVSYYPPDAPPAQAIAQGSPIYTHTADPLMSSTYIENQREGLRAFACIPVRYKGKVIAAVIVSSHTRDSVPQSSRTALDTIAAGEAR